MTLAAIRGLAISVKAGALEPCRARICSRQNSALKLSRRPLA
jgi:hypothetical protein